MKTKSEIIADTIAIIEKNKNNEIYFFSKLKNPDWFLELANQGFFNLSRIPETNSAWAQSEYLQIIASCIHEGKITDSVYISKYLEIIRNLFTDKGNSSVGISLFKCVTKITANLLQENDIEAAFNLNSQSERNDWFKIIAHEGISDILKSTTEENVHSRKILKLYIKNLFQMTNDNSSKKMDMKLAYFDDYSLKSFEENYFNLNSLFSEKKFVLNDAIEVFYDLLENLVPDKNLDINTHYWRPAIEEHPRNKYYDSAESIYVGMISKISNFLISKNEKINRELVEKWKNSNKKVFNRIYIAITTKYSDSNLITECAEKILIMDFEDAVRHEIFHFLSKHFQELSIDLQDRILNKIESLKLDYKVRESEKELFIAWNKIHWLQAIKSSNNIRAQQMYKDVFQITKNERKDPDFSTEQGEIFCGPISPWSLEDFDKATVDDIFKKFLEFKDTDDFLSPSMEGLSRIFEKYIIQDPIKCSSIIDNCLQFSWIYVSSLFNGYSTAWQEKKDVPVEKLLSLANEIIDNNHFKNEIKDEKSKTNWVASSIFRFIESGIRDDNHDFDKKFNPICYQILLKYSKLILPNQIYVNSSDAYTRALNEPRGKLFETAIILILRQVHNIDKSQIEFKNAWNDLLQLIENPLNSQNVNEVSLHALLGVYYRQFIYLNKDWFYSKLDIIAPLDMDKEPLWVGFMEGFCYVTPYDQEIYKYLYRKGHLLKFLRYMPVKQDKNSRLDRLQGKMIELAFVAYVKDDESLENGIINEIIKNKDPDEWHNLVWCIPPIFSNEHTEVHLKKAKSLILCLLDIREKNGGGDKWVKHFSGSARILDLLKDPSEEIVKKFIELTVSYRDGPWGLGDVIEYLHKYRDSHTKVVGDLFLNSVLSRNTPPIWPEEKIQDICNTLKKSDKETFAKICRVYSEKLVDCGPIRNLCQ